MRSILLPDPGPFFDQLAHGQVFDRAPAVTLTDGLAASHQAIVGDRLRLPLDRHLSAAVTGGALAHPGLVTDVAIGQSTLVTRHVKANLFYRGLRFRHFPRIGDTLATRTEVVGLTRNRLTPSRPATGLAALRMTTTDQNGRTVLDFHRCAMLPLAPGADPHAAPHADDLSDIGVAPSASTARTTPAGWDVAAYRAAVPGADDPLPAPGTVLRPGADVVTSAPELARLTGNIAAIHHDFRAAGGERLVYGGHTIGLALAQATRALPAMLTVLGWRSCDHTGPVREGDTLSSEVIIGETVPLDGGGTALEIRSLVRAHRPGTHHAGSAGGEDGDGEGGDASGEPVLDWSFTALMP